MSNFNKQKERASDLRKENQYGEALTIYRKLWDENPDRFDEWDTWSYAKSAQRCEEHDEASRIARHCYNEWPEFDMGRQVLAWSHYYRFFRSSSDEEVYTNSHWKAANEVITLCEEEDRYSKYNPFVRIIFSIVQHLENQSSTIANGRKRLKWLDHINPDKLSTQSEVYQDSSGERRVQASDLEQWYSHMSKALLSAERFKECIERSEEGIERVPQLHYDNEVWFKARAAKAKFEMEQYEDALADFKFAALRNSRWHLFKEIALVAYHMGKYDEALRNAAEAALDRSDPLHFKWELFLLMAMILRQQKKADVAKKHAHLSARIRDNQGWRIAGRKRKLFEEFEVDPEEGPPPNEIESVLRSYWKEWVSEMLPEHNGEVDWIHDEEPFGFVKSDKLKDSVYFSKSSLVEKENQYAEGTKVSFRVKDSYDNKKDRMSKEAVHIETAN
jgi:tetratricopeptide (TPR) repeat protein